MNDQEILDFVKEESARFGIDEPNIEMRNKKLNFGNTYCQEWRIILNKKWCHQSGEIIVKQLISHELMHLRDYWIRGHTGHDRIFKDMCQEFGVYLSVRASTKNQRNKIVKKVKYNL